MPEIVDESAYLRGVAVTQTGHFVGMFQWLKGTGTPKLNSPLTPDKDALIMLTSEAAITDPIIGGKWDFFDEVWLAPDTPIYLFDARGQYRGKKMFFADNIKLPDGVFGTTDAPPASRTSRPIWLGDDGGWRFPRRVAMQDANGLIVSVPLENPRDDQPNVPVPPGLIRRMDDDDPEWQPVGPGVLEHSGGFKNLNERFTKGDIVTAMTAASLTAAFNSWRGQNGYEDSWSGAGNSDTFPVLGLIYEFLVEEGWDADQIVSFIEGMNA